MEVTIDFLIVDIIIVEYLFGEINSTEFCTKYIY